MNRFVVPSFLLVAAVACSDGASSSKTSAATSPPRKAVVAKPAAESVSRVNIADPAGARLFSLVKRDDGAYNLKDAAGEKIGKVKVQADRVKAKDSSGTHRAKVKRRDDGGFKLVDANEVTVFKAKAKGGGKLKVVQEDGAVLGKITGGHKGRFGDATVEVRTTEKGLEVLKNGAALVTVSGTIKTEAALMWGAFELNPYERAALVVYVLEHR